MTHLPEREVLAHALETCSQHAQTLDDALDDLAQRNLSVDEYARLGKDDRRLLDQFAYRYMRLQDDMGAKLFPAALRALGEDVAPMPMLDRLARLEQLRWLPSADEWVELRRIRNEFAHDYPDTSEERFARLALAIAAATRVVEIFGVVRGHIHDRFPEGN